MGERDRHCDAARNVRFHCSRRELLCGPSEPSWGGVTGFLLLTSKRTVQTPQSLGKNTERVQKIAGEQAIEKALVLLTWRGEPGGEPVGESRWCKHWAKGGNPSSGAHSSPRPRNHPTHRGTAAVMRFNYCRALHNQLGTHFHQCAWNTHANTRQIKTLLLVVWSWRI